MPNKLKIVLLILVILSSLSFASDKPFNNISNWGGTGLMEIPNARIADDGVFRFGFSQSRPYRWYTASLGIFPGFEFSGRITEITNKEEKNMIGYGNDKDKCVDLKYQIFSESKILPSIVIGVNDLQGTRLFSSEYIVFSRQILPFDFTIGLGTGRLSGSPLSFNIGNERIGIFSGIEFLINNIISLQAEYNPIEYEKDKFLAVPEGKASSVNIGFKLKPIKGFDLGVTYQRGRDLGFLSNIEFVMGKPIVPKRPDPRLWYPVDRTPFYKRNLSLMVENIKQEIKTNGFQFVSVYTKDKEITVEAENDKYLSNTKAAGRIFRILLFYSPDDAETLSIILKQRNIQILKISMKPETLNEYLLGNISIDNFKKYVEVGYYPDKTSKNQTGIIKTSDDSSFSYNLGIKPEFETYLNDPSGAFKYRPGIKPYVNSNLWKGGATTARFDIPFYSNISSSNVPPPDAIKSDSWKYLDKYYTFDRLLLDQIFRLSEKTFSRITTGYFDRMYGGIGGELLTFFGKGNLAVGIESDWVKKREINTLFSFTDFERHTILGNLYYNFKSLNTIIQAQYGKFLAEDIGWKFKVSREYDTGASFGFWYSLTDNNNFTEFNKGYNDKGVFVNLPVRMFTDYEVKTKYNYSLSPWTRDVASTISHWQTLFDFAHDLTPSSLESDFNKFKE